MKFNPTNCAPDGSQRTGSVTSQFNGRDVNRVPVRAGCARQRRDARDRHRPVERAEIKQQHARGDQPGKDGASEMARRRCFHRGCLE